MEGENGSKFKLMLYISMVIFLNLCLSPLMVKNLMLAGQQQQRKKIKFQDPWPDHIYCFTGATPTCKCHFLPLQTSVHSIKSNLMKCLNLKVAYNTHMGVKALLIIPIMQFIFQFSISLESTFLQTDFSETVKNNFLL